MTVTDSLSNRVREGGGGERAVDGGAFGCTL